MASPFIPDALVSRANFVGDASLLQPKTSVVSPDFVLSLLTLINYFSMHTLTTVFIFAANY